jgi:hypothetical protein
MKIVVSKTGMPACTLPFRGATGETGETEGLLRHLVAVGHDVTFLGMWIGDPVPGVKTINIESEVLDELATFDEQEKVCRKYADDVGVADAFIDMCGSGAGRSWICDGPYPPARDWYLRTMQAICAIGMLGCPRIACSTDIRCYPHELDWREPDRATCAPVFPSLKPVAVLSQKTHERKVFAIHTRGQTWRRREVYAGIENWDALAWDADRDQQDWQYLEATNPENRVGVCIIAHAHIKTGFGKRQRDDVFKRLLSNPAANGLMKVRVYGEGWEHFSGYHKKLMPGKIKMAECAKKLRSSVCGVLVPPEDSDWVTSKIGMYVRQGCAPIFYGRGEEFTYDKGERYVPLDSPFRACTADDLHRIYSKTLTLGAYRDYMRDLVEKVKPNFKRLDACLDAIASKEDTNSDKWWRRYGGHRKA